jgi:hypothetical protein
MWQAQPELPGGGSEFAHGDRADEDLAAASGERCAQFSMTIVELVVPALPRPMRVPVYRCALAEQTLAILHRADDGAALAHRLEAPPLAGQRRLLYGPDLEAISPPTCTADRCERSCRPSFAQIVADYAVEG